MRLRATWNKTLSRPAFFVLLLAAPLALSEAADLPECDPGEERSTDGVCRPVKNRRLRRPVRLISPADVSAAGNYREIPLAGTPEAALSERASDVLQKQSGVQVNRAGAPGTQSFLGLRGSSPDQVEYFIEGMPIARPYNAPLNLEAMPLPLFRSVDVYPSFIPSHLPATNLGGALNFRLREPASGETQYLTQLSATSLVGNSAALGRLTDRSLHFVNFEQSRNRYRFLSNNGTPENTADDVIDWRKNEDFSRIGYTGFFRNQPSGSGFSALVDAVHTDRGLAGTISLPLSAVRRSEDRASLALQYRLRLNEQQALQFMTAGSVDRATTYDPQRELFAATSETAFSPQLMTGASYAYRTPTVDAGLHARGRYQTVNIAGKGIAERRELQAALNAAWDRRLFRLAAQTAGTFGSDLAAANAFFASAEKTIAQQGLSGSAIAALRPLHFFDREQGSDALLEFYAQVSSAYRAPTLYERFGDNVFVTPSDNLHNEQAITNAGGVKASVRCLARIVCSLRSEAWLTGASDYILFTQNSARTLIAVNASSAQIRGVENEVVINYEERALLSLRYTWLDARDYGSVPYYQEKYLPQRPRHHAVASLSYLIGQLRLLTSVEYRGAVFRDRYNSYYYYLPAKFLWDAGADYIIQGAAKHTLNLTVKNITDNQEPDIIGYALPGRYVLVRWTAEF